MKRVGIADLKAHLSRYLAEVQAGETIIVCDRRRPVARISGEVTGERERPELSIRKPTEPLSKLQDLMPAPAEHQVDVVELLRELRKDSWE